MSYLAETLNAQGDHADAERLERRVLELSEIVLGSEHPDTLTAMFTLGVLISREGDLGVSLQLFRKCLQGRRKVLGEHHSDTNAAQECVKLIEDLALDEPGSPLG
jgi:hypothetical protein